MNKESDPDWKPSERIKRRRNAVETRSRSSAREKQTELVYSGCENMPMEERNRPKTISKPPPMSLKTNVVIPEALLSPPVTPLTPLDLGLPSQGVVSDSHFMCKIPIEAYKEAVINQQNESTGRDETTTKVKIENSGNMMIGPVDPRTYKNSVDILDVKILHQASKDVETQTDPVVVTKPESADAVIQTEAQNVTESKPNYVEIEIQTDEEVVKKAKYVEIAIQTDEEVVERSKEHNSVAQGGPVNRPSTPGASSVQAEARENIVEKANNNFLYMLFHPYEPRRIVGSKVGRHLTFYKYYEAIEIVGVGQGFKARVFPTEWIPITSKYWNEFRESRILQRIGGNGRWFSSYDDQSVLIQVQQNGTIWATRNQVTVIISYPDGSAGDIYQYPELEIIKDEKIVCSSVPTEMIGPKCPYWHNLLCELTFPANGRGFSKLVRSPDDGVSCCAHIEVNSQIDVTRNGVRVRVREGFKRNRGV